MTADTLVFAVSCKAEPMGAPPTPILPAVFLKKGGSGGTNMLGSAMIISLALTESNKLMKTAFAGVTLAVPSSINAESIIE